MRRLAALFIALITIVPALRADDKLPDPIDASKSLRQTFADINAAIKQIKDKDSADKAAPTLRELCAKFDAEINGFVKKFPALKPAKLSDEQRTAFKNVEKEMEKLFEAFTSDHDRVAKTMPDVFRSIAHGGPFELRRKNLELTAIAKARTIATAAKAYYVKETEFPKSLDQLTKGGYFEAESDTKDPWGREFQYEPGEDETGLPVPYVWTISPYDGKTVLGRSPMKKKEPKK